jgi:acetate kinase
MILVINCGSSSVKFAVMEPLEQVMLVSGLAEKLGSDNAEIAIKIGEEKEVYKLGNAAHTEALAKLVEVLRAHRLLEKLTAIGHRTVHGGDYFSDSVLITQETVDKVTECNALAPLHNPANLLGIAVCAEQLPNLPQVAVFDTAFHQTMPDYAYLYATPRSWERDHHVRRYGFHGTSHRYITQKTAELLGKPQSDLNIISAHLGNGSSVAAVVGGKSVDTSMGFTPLPGLIMGTRTGDIDPAIITYMMERLNVSAEAVLDLMNKKSGLLGISELTNDCRELTEAANKGNSAAQLALDMFCYRLAKYIAEYMVPLQRIDALVFTGGIGENSAIIREKVLGHLRFLGFIVDAAVNDKTYGGKTAVITTAGSTRAMVVNTNEELMIALDTYRLTRTSGKAEHVSFENY